jgi:tetratricopeptide (TPR) repeat protein
VAALLADLGYHIPAVKHLLTAKYLAMLLGGPRHPELVDIYLRLVGIYTHVGEYDVAQRLLVEAKNLTQDVNKQALISSSIAEVHDKMGNLEIAVSEQRGVYKVMETLYGPEDERALKAKRNVEKYLRNLTISKVNAARAAQESKEKRNGQVKVVQKDNTYIYNRDSIKLDEKVAVEVSVGLEEGGGREEEKGEKKKNSNKKNKKNNKKR